ncbi:MAG: tetratricopeptide repeat protein [Planctomycetota bacterium]
MKEKQGFKYWSYALCLCLCLLFINCSSSSICLGDTQIDYLDPVEILISNAPDNPNEPEIPQPDMKITETQPVIKQTQSVFPLDFTASFDQNLAQNPSFVYEKSMPEPSSQLFQASISILSNDDDNSKIKNELHNLIEQINKIQLEPETIESQSNIAAQAPQTQQPVIQAELEQQERPGKKQTTQAEDELSYKPIADQTLQRLDKLGQQPDRVDNPFELAELLFLSNHFDKAAIFYAEALNRTSTVNSISAQRKAWILYQMGNCLRKSEPDRAKQVYTQLINEFPESSWIEPAKSQLELIDWFQKDQPEKIISDIQS